MILCYYASVPGPETARAALPRLPRWRRERAEKIQNEAAFCRSVGAGLLYVRALETLGLDPGQPVEYLAAGKPVRAAGDVHFSLSHSGPFVLCALGDGPLGADIQEPRPVRLSMARRFCPAERETLEALPSETRTEALLRLWCRKEAWVKAESRERMLALDEYDVRDGSGPWRFTDFSLPDGVLGSICARETAPAPQCIDIKNF